MAIPSAHHLAPQGGGFEPQRTFDYELDITDAPNWGTIKMAVQSFTPPGANNDPIELPYMNEVIFVAGQGRWDTSDVVVRDFVDKKVYKGLTDWKKQVHNPENGQIGFASDYKKEGDIYLYNPKGAGARLYHLIGLWPSVLRGDSLDYTNNSVYIVNMTLSVDRAYPVSI